VNLSRAVSTDISRFLARVVVAAARRCGGPSVGAAPQCPQGFERGERTADDHLHADRIAPATPLRPSASGSRPTHRGRDDRHGSRGPTLDGAWMARRRADGRGQCGGGESHGAGTPAGDPDAASPRREAGGAAPFGLGPVTSLRIPPVWRASAGRTGQAADPARRGTGAHVYTLASRPPLPGRVPQVDFRPGVGGKPRVRSPISRLALARHRID
jgi:hypothetical protein